MKRIVEHVQYTLPSVKLTQAIESVIEEGLPEVLFTEIRAITANWLTRNKTYYPSESLIGVPNNGTGAISFIYPYPVPLLRDHISSPDVYGSIPAMLPYGRIYNASFQNDPRSDGGWLKTIAAITDPYAIESVLTGRFLTVSIGADVEEVRCSICNTNLAEEGLCEHNKGEVYNDMVCYWIMGPIKGRELSFVNVPSDVNACVTNTSIDAGEARLLLTNSGADSLFDLATGTNVSREHTLGISKQNYSKILESAKEFRAIYKEKDIPSNGFKQIFIDTKQRSKIAA